MTQADSASTTTRPYLHFATRMEIREAVAAGEMSEREANELIASYTLPTRPMPIAQPVGTGWMPVIYHPERTVEYLRFERFPRKAKARRCATPAACWPGASISRASSAAAARRRCIPAISKRLSREAHP